MAVLLSETDDMGTTMVPRFSALVLAVLIGSLLGVSVIQSAHSQIEPLVRDRAVASAIAVALVADVTEDGKTEPIYIPVGSGTVVSPDGLILTNHHVVDMKANRAQLDRWEAGAQREGKRLAFELDEDRVLILGADTDGFAVPRYIAHVEAEDAALDLAVLRVSGDERGRRLDPERFDLPFVPLGDSDALALGDPIDVFAYPSVGGDSLSYSTGVVSGFLSEEGVKGRAWIKTDATLSGGSSGGAALDRAGRLVGVPTQGAALDCRPGDTDGDGALTAEDVGCVPTGGSFGQLRPINLARPILRQAGFKEIASEPFPTPLTTPAPSPTPMPPSTAAPQSTQVPRQSPPSGTMSFEEYLELLDRQRQLEVEKCLSGPIYMPGTRVEVVHPTHLYNLDGTGILKQKEDSGEHHRELNEAYDSILEASSDMRPFTIDDFLHTPNSVRAMTQDERKMLAQAWADTTFSEQAPLQEGAVLVITGPFAEWGTCDGWPVEVIEPKSLEGRVGYVPERHVRLIAP